MLDIINFKPLNEQERIDKDIIIEFINKHNNAYCRDNLIGHLTASSWIVNADKTKVLMVYHNIYNSWSWTGGHMDNDKDFLKVALKEASEETGIDNFKVLNDGKIYSLEILPVNSHVKKGKFVNAHLHFNITYLLEASESDSVRAKLDENKDVSWIDILDIPKVVSEKEMIKIYNKLNERL